MDLRTTAVFDALIALRNLELGPDVVVSDDQKEDLTAYFQAVLHNANPDQLLDVLKSLVETAQKITAI